MYRTLWTKAYSEQAFTYLQLIDYGKRLKTQLDPVPIVFFVVMEQNFRLNIK